MIHIITENEEESFKVITEIFCLQQRPETNFQVEIKGHIFVEGRRVAKRSFWYRRILGVMASPFDLRKVKERTWDDATPAQSHAEAETTKSVEVTILQPHAST